MIRITSSARTAVAIGAVGVAVLGFAPTASGTTNDTLNLIVGQNSYTAHTYTSSGSLGIFGVAQPDCSVPPTAVTLSISGPGVIGTDSQLASVEPNCKTAVDVSPAAADVDTASPSWSNGVPAMNGTYTVTMVNNQRSTPVTFTLLIPPTKTTGFKATPAGTNADFSWTANPEPDIIGYVIRNAAGTVVATPVATHDCTSAGCSDKADLGSAVAGHTEKFSIVAVRSCGGATCTGGMVYGKSAATTTAKFATATTSTPTPTPTPTPTKTSGSGGGGNGSTGTLTGGKKTPKKTGTLSNPTKTVKHHHKHGLGGGLVSFGGGSLPTLNVPALPDGTSTVAAGGEPTTLGKPGGNLKYPAPEVATKKKVRTEVSAGGITHDLSVAVNERPLWRGIAAAAVLLLIAVHLRTWAGRTDTI